MQDFLLELGSGFAFVGRQVRLTLEGRPFLPRHGVLPRQTEKCYVVIDLKLDKLSHADLGQMQLYVNYYDREIATTDDNPTIGLILCTEKNDAVVRYVLGENNQQIFASRYQLHLPTEEELQRELRREMDKLSLPDSQGSAQSERAAD
ncbi:MAG: PDDEXK nuclease domain-containing protein [Thiolinea sp.]